jgi:hypothetical protein
VSLDVESELDRIYRGPASDFVAQRNQLVRGLKQAGQKEQAERVARLPRPSPLAWTVNQLHFAAPELLDGIRETGKALRHAQESAADVAEFGARKREHQDALRAATDRAVTLASDGGLATDSGARRRLEATLNLIAAAPGHVEPPPGRMSAELESLGFDAITTVAPAAPRKERKPAPLADDAERAQKLIVVKEALDAAEKELRRLERETELAESSHTRASRDVEDAERRADAARQARDDARLKADLARAHQDTAAAAVTEARAVVKDLER